MAQATELEYLKFFFREADFGPADSDIRDLINERFEDTTGKDLPEGYGREEEEGYDEEDEDLEDEEYPT
ncbi:hypothetical protein Q5H92_14990 [Hymenobacter sp. M29]|uniref:Uncharacterized protein n=1 Tax=Hymenobacter mellowenesis TaxID=3063995 RepID=A0ABT9ACV6_9BACT|nr:hypothetical protein [Hymenobacter sp. M29]MDO7847673.1 hypothetical protein [Hymenobacter sp. M29]